jgi:hypothetical protein
MRDSQKQKKWLEVLEKSPTLLIKGETSREIRSVNDLVENGFLVVSEGYMSWVVAEEEKRLVRTVKAESGSLKAEAQALKVRRLEQRIRGLENRLTEKRGRVQTLTNVANKYPSIVKENRILANRLAAIEASRSWRLLNKLARLRSRAFFRKSTSGS